ncbi:MAG: MerR family transcriptional regulator [Boseongicola sp.]|nr:MerR family transcriptional regulator [Boseongicola sp.]
MQKSREAFRTISEVADWLEVPAHVLRFWETRFAQIKPTKRAGGRRYYRPADMQVIGGIKTLLRDKGMTIRGVQKLLREQGVSHVSSFSIPLASEPPEQETQDQVESIAEDARHVPAHAAPAKFNEEVEPIRTGAGERGSLPQEEAGSAEFRSGDADTKTGGSDSGAQAFEAAEEAGPGVQPVLEAAREAETSGTLDTDPEDDAEEFARDPGIAARVILADRARLRAHRNDLLKAVERLRILSSVRSRDS